MDEIIAKGEADIGFQEVAELLPVPGITFVGKLPADLKLLTVFSAGIAKKSQHVEIAKELIQFLASPDPVGVIKNKGLEPLLKQT